MLYHVSIAGGGFEVELEDDGARLDGQPVEVGLQQTHGAPVRSLLVNHVAYRVVAEGKGHGAWRIRVGGSTLEVDVVDERTKVIRDMARVSASAQGPQPVVAPMPGMVVKVEVSEGDIVEAGQGVVIVEAMKMENELRALGPGAVTAVHVREGDAVEKDQILIDFGAIQGDGD